MHSFDISLEKAARHCIQVTFDNTKLRITYSVVQNYLSSKLLVKLGGACPPRTPRLKSLPLRKATFERSLLGTTISYEGLAEHGKRYIPKLAGRRVPDAFRRLLENTKFSKLIKVKKLKKSRANSCPRTNRKVLSINIYTKIYTNIHTQ